MRSEQQVRLVKMMQVLFPGVKIYLFGSRARGTHKPYSDFDLAFDAGRKISGLEIVQAKNVIEALNIAQTVDIVDLNSVPDYLKAEIAKEGILWTD